MVSVKNLVRTQKALNEQLVKAIANHTKTTKARTESYYQTRIETINAIWNRFVQNNVTIHQSDGDDAAAYIEDPLYESTNEKYVEFISELREELKSFSKTDEIDNARERSIIETPKSDVKLPTITIPKFDGTYRAWRSFYDLFKSMVHKDPYLSKVQKFHYLKTCLTGEAERLIRQFEITNDNYQKAWDFLIKRYDNKRVLVTTQLKLLFNQPIIKHESAQTIKNLIDQTEESLHDLRALGICTSNWDPILVHLLVQKLPAETHYHWEQKQGSQTTIPSYADLVKFLESRFRTLEALQDNKITRVKENSPNNSPPKHTYTFLNKSPACVKCKQNHSLFQCSAFRKLSPAERLQFAQHNKLCKNCLRSGHNITSCKSQKNCLQCNQRHNTLLHIEQSSKLGNSHKSKIISKQGEPNLDRITDGSEAVTQTFFSNNPRRALLSTALVGIESSSGQVSTMRALIDSGSQVSFMTETASKRLNLKRQSTSVEVTGLGKTQTAHVNTQVTCKLKSLHTTYETKLKALVVMKITDLIPVDKINIKNLSYVQTLQLADPKFHTPSQIDILLGADTYAQIIESGVIKGAPGEPTAQNTQLGWILMGNTNSSDNSNIRTFTTQTNLSTQTDQLLRRFWELEEVPMKSIHPDDEACERAYVTNTKRLENGQYQVKIPFREPNGPELGQTRTRALMQYVQLEKRLSKDANLYCQYKKCINEYIELGHMEEITPAELTRERKKYTPNINHYYLPHHAVMKKSSTTKLRVVFNASTKSANGRSLNEQMLVGPTIQPSLWAIILKWRLHQVAYTADIEKIYRMIQVHPEHTDFQRILWRKSKNAPINDFRLTTVTFGTAAAPYLAIRTLHQLSEDEQHNFPLAAESLKTDFYVDDLLTGAHDITTGLRLQRELISILNKGGFNLRKWTSNYPELLENIPPNHREVKAILNLSEDDTIKTLGLQWHPITDEFSFKVTDPLPHAHFTKRIILSETAALFDPLGWLAPSVIIAKIFIQSLWLTKFSWDEPLPDSISLKWKKFRESLTHLSKIRIPRWVNFTPNAKTIQIHGFCDASITAYAAAVYIRIAYQDNSIHTHLFTSKTKVAPIKTVSLARLEMCGAVLLTRLLKQIMADVKLQNSSIYARSDSEVTLSWIQKPPNCWKTFVANRVAEIQETIHPKSWRYVPSKQNPADCASRGLQPEELSTFELWWTGPSWLQKHSQDWPTQPSFNKRIELDTRKVKALNCTSENVEWLTKYSSFPKLVRIIAYCKRFISNCRACHTNRNDKYLTYSELREAEMVIITTLQKFSFSHEYQCLKDNQPIPKRSPILSLNPFMDANKLIRVGGRLKNSILPYDQKHPIIIPNKHHISNILINHIHRYSLHGGPQLVLTLLRNKYWLLNAKNTIRHQIQKCIPCFKTKPTQTKQIMGDLPPIRVTPTLTFEHTGVDYAGPINVKTSKLRNAKLNKGYLSIFVCMATKAIHIEVVSELTTVAFIAALKRFISRRGLCLHLYSDCGTNFIGASKELCKQLQRVMHTLPERIAADSDLTGITWHFNPPSAPHFGGLWEAAVKTIKTHMKKTLQNASLTYEELTTTICQIEACVNSRPLTALSNDPNNLNVLTPGHFLTGRQLKMIPEPSIPENISSLKRWQYIQWLTNQFWKQWSKEYLHSLQQRSKWQTPHDNIQINDIVLIEDYRLPPTKWPLGRVTQISPGTDNKVRVATIKTVSNSFLRPISKLYKLPNEDQPLTVERTVSK